MMRERRQTSLSATTTTPVSPPSASAVVDSDPTSAVNLSFPSTTKALAVVVAVLCTIILLGVGICMFRRWKKRNEKTSTPLVDFTSEKPRRYDVESKLDLHASAYGLEKPSPAFMLGGDMNPNWVPQVPPNRGADLVSSTTTTSKSRKSRGSTKNLRSIGGWSRVFHVSNHTGQWSPPPCYNANDPASGEKPAIVVSQVPQVPLPPSPPHQAATLPPTPPTPPIKKKNPFSREGLPPAKPAPMGLPPLPLPSPARSASFAVHQSASFSPTEQHEEEVHKMPRLMNVISTFAPTLDDELSVQIGETVHVLDEYQDGWALVQRIGHDAPRGVVPRSCLAERERLIPTYL